MKYIKKISTIIFLLLFSLSLTSLISVDIVNADMSGAIFEQMGALSEKSGYSAGEEEPAVLIEGIIASIIQYLLSFLGVIFIILIIYAGFLWMTASGDSEKITKAKDILISAVIGIIIILSAYIITTAILTKLGAATGT